jgi:HAD superfamily hydrolase (TIGR01509 family)
MLEGIKAVIFDLDGTLVDSMWMWTEIDIEYLGKHGYELPPDLQREIEGMGFTETAVYFKERFQLPDTLDEIMQEWLDMAYDKYKEQVPMKPGAKRFLEQLSDMHIQCAIASSNSRALINACLESNKVSGYFSCVRTSCDVAKGKPAPDVYLSAAQELGVSPGDCLVFEDVPMGILAGKNAGMKVCAMEDSHSAPQREEIRRLADYYIRSFDDVLDHTYEVMR